MRLTHEFYGPRPHISRFSRWLAGVGMLKSRSSLNELERNSETVLRIPNPKRTLTRGEYRSRARRRAFLFFACFSRQVYIRNTNVYVNFDIKSIEIFNFPPSPLSPSIDSFQLFVAVVKFVSQPKLELILCNLRAQLPREKSQKAAQSSHRRKLSRNAGLNNDDQQFYTQARFANQP